MGILSLIYATAARSRSKPIRENQLDKAGNPAGTKSLIADFALSVLLPGLVAPVRRGAVEVGKSVLLGQPPHSQQYSRNAFPEPGAVEGPLDGARGTVFCLKKLATSRVGELKRASTSYRTF